MQLQLQCDLLKPDRHYIPSIVCTVKHLGFLILSVLNSNFFNSKFCSSSKATKESLKNHFYGFLTLGRGEI